MAAASDESRRNGSGQAEFCRGAQVRAGGGINSHHFGDPGIDRSGATAWAAGRKEFGDVGLPNHVSAAQDEIAKCGALIPRKEESLVVNDRTTDSATVLIALDLIVGGGGSEIVLGIEVRIANKLEDIAVEIVGTGLGDDVDDATGILTVLGAVVAGLDAEFLESIGKRKRLIDVGVFIDVIAAIELVTDGVLPGAVRRVGHGPRKGFCGTLVSATVGGVDGPSN